MQEGDGATQEISALDNEGIRNLLDSLDTFIFDCDGVLWRADRAFPESSKLISLLRRLGKKVCFITNNTLYSHEDHLAKLQRAGIHAEKDEFVFPVDILCHHLHEIQFKGNIEYLGDSAARKEVQSRGFILNDDKLVFSIFHEEEEFLNAALVKEPTSAVILDVSRNWNLAKITRLLHVLNSNPDCLFFATALDRTYPVTAKLTTVATGYILSMIEEFTGRKPQILGKPSTGLYEILEKRFSLDPKRTIFVGDTLESDIGMAKNCGIRSILVLTGSTKRENIPYDDPSKRPNYVSDSVAELLSLLLDLVSNCEKILKLDLASRGFLVRPCSPFVRSSAAKDIMQEGPKNCGDGATQEISALDNEGIRNLLDSLDTFIFDCDGVIWRADRVFPESSKLISLLRRLGKKVCFITNNTLHSQEDHLAKLQRAGIHVEKDEFVFPVDILCHHLHEIQFKGNIEYLGDDASKKELQSRGFNLNDNKLAFSILGTEKNFINAIIVKEPTSAVVVDVGLNWNLAGITRIVHVLTSNPDCLFFGTALDKKYPITATVSAAGPGHILPIIKDLTGREATILGKPSSEMFKLLEKKFSLDTKRTIFVGDSLDTDIPMAKNCGIRSILVLTGITKRENIPYDDPSKRPNYVSDGVAELFSLLETLSTNLNGLK